jgi:hypothetical protein
MVSYDELTQSEVPVLIIKCPHATAANRSSWSTPGKVTDNVAWLPCIELTVHLTDEPHYQTPPARHQGG